MLQGLLQRWLQGLLWRRCSDRWLLRLIDSEKT
jgi:hypothetical protein